MGANLQTYRYPASDTKAEITKKWDEITAEYDAQFGANPYCGTIGQFTGVPIQWKDQPVYRSAHEAEEFLADNHEKGCPPLAVKFKDLSGESWMIGGWCRE